MLKRFERLQALAKETAALEAALGQNGSVPPVTNKEEE